MEPAHYHIIEKVYVDVDTTDIQYANELKNDMGEFLKNEVFPLIELLLDDCNLPDFIVRYDKIELDFTITETIDFEKLKNDIVRQMGNKLISQIDSLSSGTIQNAAVEIQNPKIKSISHHQNFESVFLFFLSNGHFPWYGNRSRFEDQMSSENWDIHLRNRAFTEKLKKLLSDNENAANRFVAQFQDATIFCLLENLHPVFTSYKPTIFNFSKKLNTEFRHIFWLMLLHLAISANNVLVEKSLSSIGF
ncbi:MAG TPA: contractile injection system tape measure protein, partial [Draconibacterium sp.]|nr:contractile injection system tape measure protein [Draconibacterium sp.]